MILFAITVFVWYTAFSPHINLHRSLSGPALRSYLEFSPSSPTLSSTSA
jgi:hypothetical protein